MTHNQMIEFIEEIAAFKDPESGLMQISPEKLATSLAQRTKTDFEIMEEMTLLKKDIQSCTTVVDVNTSALGVDITMGVPYDLADKVHEGTSSCILYIASVKEFQDIKEQ